MKLKSPGVCVWDSGAGSWCTTLQELHTFRKYTHHIPSTNCFTTSLYHQLYTSNGEKFCACEKNCVINYKYPLDIQECFLTADLGQLFDSDTEMFCSDEL